MTLTNVRTILSVNPHLNWGLEQMGVVTALKNDDLEENVYMSVLEGLSSDATRNKI